MADSSSPRQGILSLSIKDKNALYQAYIPYVNNGGLFIPTDRDYKMGQEVFMLLNLMEEPERLPIAGKVVWKTPIGSSGYRTAGIGVQFSDQDGGLARSRIENYLAGSLSSDRSTHTM
jgi:type IV pilus assembly protein PilZ